MCVSGAAKIRINILNKFLSLNTRIGSFSLFTYDMISLDRETRVVLVNFLLSPNVRKFVRLISTVL